ncbi:MAG: carbohydrate ABC transporter permease [Gammaproteobacteria bacterium]|nr:MAG: carbohydrate ABC transporter permease [Gammaproteobacteria bacterium]
MLYRLSLGQKVIYYSLLVLLALIIVFPIYYMFSISLKIPKDIYRDPSLLPTNPTIRNYVELFTKMDFLVNIRNSITVAGTATLISVLISCLAAYSLVRLRYKGRDWIGRLILFTYLTPSALLFIPLSVIIARIHLGNTLQGLIFVYLTFSAPLSTWLLMGYFRSIPADLEEQAMVDGATRLQALFRIVLPLAAPGLVAVGILTFTSAWNELLLALIFITSPSKQTVPVAISYLITGDVFRWGQIMAASVSAAIPVMLLYYLGQRFVVQGLAAGAVKG